MHLQLVLYEPAVWDWEKHVWEMLLTLRGTSDRVHEVPDPPLSFIPIVCK